MAASGGTCGFRVDHRLRRVYFGTRIHEFRIHHGPVGVGCVCVGSRVKNRLVSTALVAFGSILAWDDLPDLRKSWWIRDV